MARKITIIDVYNKEGKNIGVVTMDMLISKGFNKHYVEASIRSKRLSYRDLMFVHHGTHKNVIKKRLLLISKKDKHII